MNREIEYAEMLEIPVETVNVVHKRRRGRAKSDLKESLISKVNDKVSGEEKQEPTPPVKRGRGRPRKIRPEEEKDVVSIAPILPPPEESEVQEVEKKRRKKSDVVLNVEFAAACLLCGGIFLTNVFMPSSGINTFFQGLSGKAQSADARVYSDIRLSPVAGKNADVKTEISPSGILSVSGSACVYPIADGKILSLERAEDGTYSLTISHTDSFSSEWSGLETVYYGVGDKVYSNIPVGYVGEEKDVEVCFFDHAEMLAAYTIDGDYCPAWSPLEE